MSKRLIEELQSRQQREGLTQEEFAARLGISQGTLSRLFSGSRGLGMDTFQRVAAVYPELAFRFLTQDTPTEKSESLTESSSAAPG